jgi:hypothetical protein
MDTQPTITWSARCDVLRPVGEHDFSDLNRIIAAYFEAYSRLSAFIGPWNAKQVGSTFPYRPPERQQLLAVLGRPRPYVSERAYAAMVEAAIDFCARTKGRRQLILPSAVTHHSAQFLPGLFSLKRAEPQPELFRPRGHRQPQSVRSVTELTLFGASSPVYVENLTMHPNDVKLIIVRPRLGKLATPNLLRWEALFFRRTGGYLIEHVDTAINPRWSGII